MVTVAISLVVYAGRGMPRQPIAFAQGPLGMTAIALTALVYSTVGAFIAARLPLNPIAWIFLAIGLGMAAVIPVNMALAQSLRAFTPVPEIGLLAVWALTSVHLPASGALLVVVLLLFPHGRPEWRHWRASASLALLGCALLTAASALQPDGLLWYPTLPNPAALSRELQGTLVFVRIAGTVCLVVGLVLAAAWMIYRYRHAAARRHRQLGWVMCGALAMVTTLAPLFVVRYATGASNATGELLVFTAAVGGVMFPVTVAFACLREHLFGIHAMLSRTLVYVPLTAILGGAYAASVIVLQRLFVLFTGNSSDAAYVLATLLVASVLTPLRRSLEGAAERVLVRPAVAPSEPAGHPAAHLEPTSQELADRVARLEAALLATRSVPLTAPASASQDTPEPTTSETKEVADLSWRPPARRRRSGS